MIASMQVLASMQGFVQLLAKQRAILRSDSRNLLRSTATTSCVLLPSKQSVVGSNPTGGVSHTNGSQHCWEPFITLRAQNGAQTVANGMSGSTVTRTGKSRFFLDNRIMKVERTL